MKTSAFVLIALGCVAAVIPGIAQADDDGDWMLSAHSTQLSMDTTVTYQPTPTTLVLFRKPNTSDGTSGTASDYSVSYRFLKHLAVSYGAGQGDFPVTTLNIDHSGVIHSQSGDAAYSADTLSLEAFTTAGFLGDWAEIYARLSSQSYKFDVTAINLVGGRATKSGSFQYGSFGLRMKLVRHFGIDLGTSIYPDTFSSAYYAGLYFQF